MFCLCMDILRKVWHFWTCYSLQTTLQLLAGIYLSSHNFLSVCCTHIHLSNFSKTLVHIGELKHKLLPLQPQLSAIHWTWWCQHCFKLWAVGFYCFYQEKSTFFGTQSCFALSVREAKGSTIGSSGKNDYSSLMCPGKRDQQFLRV